MSVATNPEVITLMQSARQEMSHGRYNQAVPLLQQAVQKEPCCSELHTLLGVAYAQLRQDNEALHAFELAAGLDLANPNAQFNYAVMLDRVGRTYDAMHHLQEALKLDPHYHKAEKLLEEIQSRIEAHYHHPWEQ